MMRAKKVHIIDIRGAGDFSGTEAGKGHIEGAVNVGVPDLFTHIESIDAASFDNIFIVCYTGQTAGWCTALLRMSGYNNVSSLKFGMSGWNAEFDKITGAKNSDQEANFVTTSTPKGAAGELPEINTGETNGDAILKARIAAVHAEGFGMAAITAPPVYENPSNYYIVNYWPEADYSGIGHIPGAMQYTPKADLKLETFLKTLPTDKEIVVYCYTGQTSANVAAILRVMGYNAKSLKFGTQAMIYDKMMTTAKKPYSPPTGDSNKPFVK